MTARVAQPPRCYPERSPAQTKDLVRQLGPSSRSLLELEADIPHDSFSLRPPSRALPS